MPDKGSDPFALWQKMVGKMEKGFSTFASQAVSSPEFSKMINQAGSASAGAKKQFGDLMDKYLANMNLPSRAQLVDMAERLQNMEGQLNEIRAILQQMGGGIATSSIGTAGPPRTKRPPAARPVLGEKK
jgi:hypothetical protein